MVEEDNLKGVGFYGRTYGLIQEFFTANAMNSRLDNNPFLGGLTERKEVTDGQRISGRYVELTARSL